MKIQPCSAPVTAMPSSSPSMTRCGWSVRIWRSLNVPGSDSSALQIAYLTPPGSVAATRPHFRPVGNPAPPMPRSPDASSVATTLSALISPASSARRLAYRDATPEPAGYGSFGQGSARPVTPASASSASRAAATSASTSVAGAGCSLTATAGALSQRPRQETSLSSISVSSP